MYIEKAYLGKSPKWLYIFFPSFFFGISILGYIASLFFDSNEMMLQLVERKGELRTFVEDAMAPFVIFILILFLWVRFVHKQPIKALTTSRAKIDMKRVFFSFFLWGAIVLILFAIDYLLNPENYIWNFQADKFFLLAILAVVLIPFQAGFEEYFFRGYLMQGLGIFAKNRWMPLLFTSVLFGLVHISNPEVGKLGYGVLVYYIGTGLFLGIITLMDEGIELALGFHIANNLFGALLVTFDWGAFKVPALFRDISEPSVNIQVSMPLILIFLVLLPILAKKYGWANWKEKLTGKVLSEKEFVQKQEVTD